MTQDEAIALIKSGKNVYLGGSAGSGKSWVIRKITDKGTLLVGPTGVSALNIGGQTAHRAFGLPMGMATQDDFNKITAKVKKLLASKHLKLLVIDEISMLRADHLDMINHRLQQARGNKLKWGGVQVVVVGDFHQLEPIVSYQEKDMFYQKYATSHAFSAESWDFIPAILDKVQRQSDDTHIRVLESFRTGDKWAPRAFEWMRENSKPYDMNEDILHLACYKVDAERTNVLQYGKMPGKERTYRGSTNNKTWGKDIAAPEVLKLKVGTKVLIKANCPEGNYVNGSRGTVTEMYSSSAMVKLDSGEEVEVVEFTWETYVYSSTAKGLTKTVEFMYSQLPIQLGYSITAHSSQGMTLGRYAVDTGRGAFTAGQLYVMLSRAKDLTQVSLASNVGMRDLIVDNDVREFYRSVTVGGDS